MTSTKIAVPTVSAWTSLWPAVSAGLRQYAVAYQSSIPCGPDEAIDAADLQQQARPLPPKLIEKLRCDFTIWK